MTAAPNRAARCVAEQDEKAATTSRWVADNSKKPLGDASTSKLWEAAVRMHSQHGGHASPPEAAAAAATACRAATGGSGTSRPKQAAGQAQRNNRDLQRSPCPLQQQHGIPDSVTAGGSHLGASRVATVRGLQIEGEWCQTFIDEGGRRSAVRVTGADLASGTNSTEPQGDDQEAKPTTVMLKNIACQYTEEGVMHILDCLGLHGKYDVIYVPRSSTRQCNLGYAFVNFLEPAYVEECRSLCEGRPFGHRGSAKLCEVARAHLQGGALLGSKKGKKKERSTPLVLAPTHECASRSMLVGLLNAWGTPSSEDDDTIGPHYLRTSAAAAAVEATAEV